MRADPDLHRPVFVVGPPRSGATLLAWALGEHPKLSALLEAGWVGRIAHALASDFGAATRRGLRSQLGMFAPDLDAFLALFASSVDAALGAGDRRLHHGNGNAPRPDRWVDGTPENGLHAYALQRLFPGARFIHVVRELEGVVRGLVEVGTPDGTYFTRESACETWLRHTRACLRAETALGSDVVLRVEFRELAIAPELTLQRCLAFLGEEFHPACLRLLRGIEPEPEPGDDAPPAETRIEVEARALDARLRHGDPAPSRRPDPDLVAELETELREGVREAGGPETPVQRIRAAVGAAVPPGSTVVVVSRGDEDLVRLPGRRGWHFPQVEGGVYAGHHPACGEEAVAHLEELRERGGEYLLLPCTSFWWLDHYSELREHLEERSRMTAYHDDLCALFALEDRNEGTHLAWRWRTEKAAER